MGNRRTATRNAAGTECRITRVLTVNTVSGETANIPGMLLTAADLQGMVLHRDLSGTVNLICETCGDSVADCVELAPQLSGVPAEWSWTNGLEDEEWNGIQ